MSLIINKRTRACNLVLKTKEEYPFMADIITPVPVPTQPRKRSFDDWYETYGDHIDSITQYCLNYIDGYDDSGTISYDVAGLVNTMRQYLYECSSNTSKSFVMLK